MKFNTRLHYLILSICISLSIFAQAESNPKQLDLDYKIDPIYNTADSLPNNTNDYFWNIYKNKSEIVRNDLERVFASYSALPHNIFCADSSPFFSTVKEFAAKNTKDLNLSAKSNRREIDEINRLKKTYKQNCQTNTADKENDRAKFLKLISELFVLSRVIEARQNHINETITKDIGIIITLNHDNTVIIKTIGDPNTPNEPTVITPETHITNIGLLDNTNSAVGALSPQDKGATDNSQDKPDDISLKPGVK